MDFKPTHQKWMKIKANKKLFSRTITKQAYVVVDALDKMKKKNGIFNTIWNHKKTITLHTVYMGQGLFKKIICFYLVIQHHFHLLKFFRRLGCWLGNSRQPIWTSDSQPEMNENKGKYERQVVVVGRLLSITFVRYWSLGRL